MENGGTISRAQGYHHFPYERYYGGRWQRALLRRHGIQAGRNSQKTNLECQVCLLFLNKGTIRYDTHLPQYCGAILTLHNLFFNIIFVCLIRSTTNARLSLQQVESEVTELIERCLPVIQWVTSHWFCICGRRVVYFIVHIWCYAMICNVAQLKCNAM